MDFLPTALLMVVACLGTWVTFKPRRLPSSGHGPNHQFTVKLSAIGGFTAGLTVVWIAACFGRTLILTPWIQSYSITKILLGPISLYFAESVLLVVLVLNECRHLKGHYIGPTEWKYSFRDGIRLCSVLLVACVVCFVVSLWILTPEKLQTFRGSFVSPIVGSIAESMFASSGGATATQASEIFKTERAKTIPHATALAVLLVVLLIAIRAIVNYFRSVLDDDYLHTDDSQESGNQRKFPIRGGSPN